VVEASYGAARVSERLTLLPATQLQVNFVLNIGGIRILPRLHGFGPPSPRTQNFVYANSGPEKGKLVAVSELPGELLRVTSGEYRIESRFTSGNAVAVTDVSVKAGIMSSVEIDHVAGMVRLSLPATEHGAILWQVFDAAGTAVTEREAPALDLILKPGAYDARAQSGSETLTAGFRVEAGTQSNVMLTK
jgi:hypothetical protein